MYEVELKVRADHEQVRRRLEELGADSRGTVEQEDTYYDAPHREFGETDEALRIRQQRPEGAAGATSVITYKGPLLEDGTKTREEHETAIEDADSIDAVLRGLGFEPAYVVRKVRARYEHAGYTITLDRVEDLGEFVEVERAVPESEVDSAREGAIDVLETLGLDTDDGITTSYLGLLLEGNGEAHG